MRPGYCTQAKDTFNASNICGLVKRYRTSLPHSIIAACGGFKGVITTMFLKAYTCMRGKLMENGSSKDRP